MRIIRFSAAVAMVLAVADAAQAHGHKLEGTEWGVVGDQGDGVRFISFAGQGRLFGFAGCNRLSGSYEWHDGHLTIAPLATTRKKCAGEVMKRETEFIEMLGKVSGAKADHTLLLLLDEQGSDLRTLTRRNMEQTGD